MARPLAPCGTETAYQRHKRRSEPVDEACREEHRRHCAEKRKRKKAEAQAETQQVIQEAQLAPFVAPDEEADELTDLLYSRKVLIEAIDSQRLIDPAKISPLVKELREVHRQITAHSTEAQRTDTEEASNFGDLLGSIRFKLTPTSD